MRNAGNNSIAGQGRIRALAVTGSREQPRRRIVAKAVIDRQMRRDAPGVLRVNSETLDVLREAAIAGRSGSASHVGRNGRGARGAEIKLRRISRIKAGIVRI